MQAQDYLKSFYGSFGFQPISETYIEDSILQVDMLLKIYHHSSSLVCVGIYFKK
ncbi:hypothetical protein [Bacillus salacetis]|uniref:hypothetical protein n=1 Tax=Bacillus salacetis TaxID=2315464 RepID=UPI0030B84532